ncbi:hypothetical protein Jiend_08080 [Micromonospora endophytica]|nr:hypothetical protein Jiend_08080 [Micromonospora endophytica]
MALRDWFLTAPERGNPDSELPVWSSGNLVEPLIHGGRVGPRPPGRLRPHRAGRLPWWTRAWALPAYRLVYDPDGRPLRARRAGSW